MVKSVVTKMILKWLNDHFQDTKMVKSVVFAKIADQKNEVKLAEFAV